MAKLADNGMPALAITDTGNLFGALEFSEALREKGIQPIIGCTLKVDFGEAEHGQRPSPAPCGTAQAARSLVLLAKDETGYRNLMRLSSRAYLDTPDTAEPHVAMDVLEQLAPRA